MKGGRDLFSVSQGIRSTSNFGPEEHVTPTGVVRSPGQLCSLVSQRTAVDDSSVENSSLLATYRFEGGNDDERGTTHPIR